MSRMKDQTGLAAQEAEGRGGRRSCDLLIVNAHVLSMDAGRRVYRSGAIAISGRTIQAVGPERDLIPTFQPRRTLDARGAAVHPGFIDCHVHLMHNVRGSFPDWVAQTVQGVSFLERWWDVIEDEDEHAASLLTCLELVANGTTCFAEAGTVFEPDTAADAAEALGIRALVSDPFLFDLPSAPRLKRAPASRERALRTLGHELRRNKDSNALVRGHVCLWGGATASEDLERAAKACADEHGAVFAQHQSFNADGAHADDARFGRHPLVHFEDIGILGPNCFFSHMNLIRDDELRPVVDSGMSVCWCPLAGMVRGAGGAFRGKYAELRAQGVNVALGSDSATSGARADLSLQGLLAVLTAREKGGEGEPLRAEDALEMATVAGARALGLEEQLGSLEPGKRADLVIRSSDRPEAQPVTERTDVVQNLIFSAGSQSIDTVLVDGRIVLKGGRSTLVDEGAIYAKASESARRMTDRLHIEAQPRWPTVD